MLRRMANSDDAVSPLLPLAEAARRLGVSTLRVRQYVAEGRLHGVRDNRGRLRVVLPTAGPAEPRSPAEPVPLLLDELLDLQEDAAERDAKLQRLERVTGELARRLGEALDALEAAQRMASAERTRAETLARQTARALDAAERALARREEER
jgi:hypothetical protein